MVLLGLMVNLPFKLILTLGLVIVLGHNVLDYYESSPGFHTNFLWSLLHQGNQAFQFLGDHYAYVLYPFLPWAGLMMLGYCTGIFFTPGYSKEERAGWLRKIGIGMIVFFIVLRFVNVYGDPVPWSTQKNGLFTFLSFMNVFKYPPSLLYICITIGPALFLMPYLENISNNFSRAVIVFGRTAFFYYILHLYLIHLLGGVAFFTRGHTIKFAIDNMKEIPFLFLIAGEGYGLGIVYLVWVAVIIALFPVCKWYDGYKTHHREKRWLSYL
jgi:uncharacterized membrane protein